VLEVGPYGNFQVTGFDYGTAPGWARLGLLYPENGVWQGERLLPAGCRVRQQPASAWTEPVYGGLFWLDLRGELAVPRDAYYFAGAGGHYTIIVPSLDRVVVRLGHLRGRPRANAALNRALEELVAAVGPRGSGGSS